MRQEQSLRTNDGAEDVIRQYATMVYRLAFARSGTKDDADEIFQEVLFRYLKNQSVFESEEHCKAWLIRVTINCPRKLWSSAWRRRVLLVEEDLAFESKETADLYHEKIPAGDSSVLLRRFESRTDRQNFKPKTCYDSHTADPRASHAARFYEGGRRCLKRPIGGLTISSNRTRRSLLLCWRVGSEEKEERNSPLSG